MMLHRFDYLPNRSLRIDLTTNLSAAMPQLKRLQLRVTLNEGSFSNFNGAYRQVRCRRDSCGLLGREISILCLPTVCPCAALGQRHLVVLREHHVHPRPAAPVDSDGQDSSGARQHLSDTVAYPLGLQLPVCVSDKQLGR